MPTTLRDRGLPTGVLGQKGRKVALEKASCVTGCFLNCRCCRRDLRYRRVAAPPPDANTSEPRDVRGFRGYVERASQTRRRPTAKVIFPCRHEIRPGNLQACGEALDQLLWAECQVVVCTRASWSCVAVLCNAFRRKAHLLTFRIRIGSIDDDVLAFWEPGTPCAEERIEALKYARAAGFETSVGIDPVLDTSIAGIRRVIEAVSPHVSDSIWLETRHNMLGVLERNGWGDPETYGRAHEVVAFLRSLRWEEVRRLTRQYPGVRASDAFEARVCDVPPYCIEDLNALPKSLRVITPGELRRGMQQPSKEERVARQYANTWGIDLDFDIFAHWTFNREAQSAGMTPAQIGWLAARLLEVAGDLTPEARRLWLEAILRLPEALPFPEPLTGLRFLVQRALDQHNQANAQAGDAAASGA